MSPLLPLLDRVLEALREASEFADEHGAQTFASSLHALREELIESVGDL